MVNGNLMHQIRLYSGLVLFVLALTHFISHAFGLISIEATMAVQEWRTLVWRNPVGGVVLSRAIHTRSLSASMWFPRNRGGLLYAASGSVTAVFS